MIGPRSKENNRVSPGFFFFRGKKGTVPLAIARRACYNEKNGKRSMVMAIDRQADGASVVLTPELIESLRAQARQGKLTDHFSPAQ